MQTYLLSTLTDIKEDDIRKSKRVALEIVWKKRSNDVGVLIEKLMNDEEYSWNC